MLRSFRHFCRRLCWSVIILTGVEGIEPSHTEPESAVLPLDDTPKNESPFQGFFLWKMAGPGGFEPPNAWTKTM